MDRRAQFDYLRGGKPTRRNSGRGTHAAQSVALPIAAVALALLLLSAAPPPRPCPAMRKINIGVAVSPPNVVHTAPYVAKALGLFAKHCVDANIIQFDGGAAGTSVTAVGAGERDLEPSGCGDRARPQGQADLGPRATSAAGLCGAREREDRGRPEGQAGCSAAGGVGGFNWLMGREDSCASGRADRRTTRTISQGTAGRLPGFIAGQIEGRAVASGGRLSPGEAKEARRACPHDDLRPDAALRLQSLRRGRCALIAKDHALARRHHRGDDRGESRDLSRPGEGRSGDHHGGDAEAEGRAGRIRNRRIDEELHPLGQLRASVRERTEWTHQKNINDGDISKPEKKLTFDQIADVSSSPGKRSKSRRRTRHDQQPARTGADGHDTAASVARRCRGIELQIPQLDRNQPFNTMREYAVLPRHAVYEPILASRNTARRYSRDARAKMRGGQGLDCVIVPGGPSHWSFGGGMLWLTGHWEWHALCCYVVVPLEGEPTLVYAMGGTHFRGCAARDRGCAFGQLLRGQPRRPLCRGDGRAHQGAGT